MTPRRLILVVFVGVASPAWATSYYSFLAENGRMIGHSSHTSRQGRDGSETVDRSRMFIQEGDQPPIEMSEETVTRRDASGRPVAIDHYSRTGTGWARSEARIADGRADISYRTRSVRRNVSIPLPAEVRFDGGHGLLRGWDRAAMPRLEFQDFNLDAMGVDRVVIEPAPSAAPDGAGRFPVLRMRYEGRDLRSVSRLLLARDGRVVEVIQPMFGASITIRATDRAATLRPLAPYSVLRSATVAAPYRVPQAAMQGRIRYRFAYRDGISFALPETGEQRVRMEGGEAVLDICAACGAGLAMNAAARAQALRPTAWLESDHPRIRAVAATFARMNASETEKMERLAVRVRRLMPRIDFSGHYSALEAMVRGEGDCTEAAVLLAALGRAAGIPTKVASGLVYSRESYHRVGHVFMPHSWVLAYVDGEWKSFDSALERFDSTHIAITVGDGDPRSIGAATQLAGLLQWQAMTEVRTRPGS